MCCEVPFTLFGPPLYQQVVGPWLVSIQHIIIPALEFFLNVAFHAYTYGFCNVCRQKVSFHIAVNVFIVTLLTQLFILSSSQDLFLVRMNKRHWSSLKEGRVLSLHLSRYGLVVQTLVLMSSMLPNRTEPSHVPHAQWVDVL